MAVIDRWLAAFAYLHPVKRRQLPRRVTGVTDPNAPNPANVSRQP
jgi:hypothetical protein